MHKLTVTEMNRLTAQEFSQAEKVPLVVVLDNVRSQHNVGSVFRTADAFLIEKIILCGCCCCPPNQEIHKTALGAELTVKWEYYENTINAVTKLHDDGYIVLAVEQVEESTMLNSLILDKQKKYAIVLGHEVFGVRQEVVDASDGCVEIPQYGTKHSLNVSVAAGVVMYKMSEELRKNKSSK